MSNKCRRMDTLKVNEIFSCLGPAPIVMTMSFFLIASTLELLVVPQDGHALVPRAKLILIKPQLGTSPFFTSKNHCLELVMDYKIVLVNHY